MHEKSQTPKYQTPKKQTKTPTSKVQTSKNYRMALVVDCLAPNRSEFRDFIPTYSSFFTIDEQISFNSCASCRSSARILSRAIFSPVSKSLSQSSHSFASLRQVRNFITRSFSPNASLASMQFAATEPEARTNCFTSSIFAIVRGRPRTNARIATANPAVLSSRSRGFSFIGFSLDFGSLVFVFSQTF